MDKTREIGPYWIYETSSDITLNCDTINIDSNIDKGRECNYWNLKREDVENHVNILCKDEKCYGIQNCSFDEKTAITVITCEI